MPEQEIVAKLTDHRSNGPPALGDLQLAEHDRAVVVTRPDVGMTVADGNPEKQIHTKKPTPDSQG